MTRQRQLRVQGVFNLEILKGNVGFVRQVRWKTACNFCQKTFLRGHELGPHACSRSLQVRMIFLVPPSQTEIRKATPMPVQQMRSGSLLDRTIVQSFSGQALLGIL